MRRRDLLLWHGSLRWADLLLRRGSLRSDDLHQKKVGCRRLDDLRVGFLRSDGQLLRYLV